MPWISRGANLYDVPARALSDSKSAGEMISLRFFMRDCCMTLSVSVQARAECSNALRKFLPDFELHGRLSLATLDFEDSQIPYDHSVTLCKVFGNSVQ